MLTKTELLNLWNEYGFRPVKRLGQNFLIDKNIEEKILANLGLNSGDTVIEIGAGFGELTRSLAEIAGKVFAIEKDRTIVRILKEALRLPSNVELLEQDFLDFDIAGRVRGKKMVVYGNLPYYITSPIIEKLIDKRAAIETIYLVVQKEVAERIVAGPGSKETGRLSLYVQYYTRPEILFKISKNSFYPAPEVESAFLKLGMRKTNPVSVKDEARMFRIIKKAYSQRRKTIANSLTDENLKKTATLAFLKSAKINPNSRPETLSLKDFARLTNVWD
ncbi:MAG: 16S rRNA (adenine(1518)-N(6)/adenine(1519)-N(6))-dimethyltransferase RsmA [Omnitrophica bacterium]|nr:16S rRNA (adenine(1518)-N(6)/adenine(1519)-N(6))-dimethyltransferase RsmA [Candidatus Omnitrophota bacterium]